MTSAGDIVVVYQAPWDWEFLWNRAQPLATAVSRHAEVLYLGVGVEGVPHSYRRAAALLGKIPGVCRWHDERVKPINPRLSLWTWRALWGDPLRLIREDRPQAYYRRLERLLRRRRDEGAELWLLLSRPAAHRLCDLLPWDKIVIDIEDPWFDLNWGRQLDEHRVVELLRGADVVFANGRRIADEYAMRSSRPVISLPNGIDTGFVASLRGDLPVPDVYRGQPPGRRAVFTGNMNDRLDYRMIATLVEEPGWTFFFVGRESIPDAQRPLWERIVSHPNVRVVPPLEHAQIPAVLEHADALLLPYFLTGHEKMFPAKLFEYAATGRPILATIDFTAGEFVFPTVQVSADAASFRGHLRRIAAGLWQRSPEVKASCLAMAENNTWEARAAEFMTVVRTARGGVGARSGQRPSSEADAFRQVRLS